MARGRADSEVMLDLYGTCDPAHAHNIADQLAWRRSSPGGPAGANRGRSWTGSSLSSRTDSDREV